MKDFGERLRAARVARGLTQEQLGFELGVTKASVSAWENNRERPAFRVLPLLPAALHQSLDHLVGGSDAGDDSRPVATATAPMVATTQAERQMLDEFRRLSSQRQRAWLELIGAAGR